MRGKIVLLISKMDDAEQLAEAHRQTEFFVRFPDGCVPDGLAGFDAAPRKDVIPAPLVYTPSATLPSSMSTTAPRRRFMR